MRPTLTLADLQRWEHGGATWRVLGADGDEIVVELCTCYGEAVDVMRAAPDLVPFLQERGGLGAERAGGSEI